MRKTIVLSALILLVTFCQFAKADDPQQICFAESRYYYANCREMGGSASECSTQAAELYQDCMLIINGGFRAASFAKVQPVLRLVDSQNPQHKFSLDSDGTYLLDFGTGAAGFAGQAPFFVRGNFVSLDAQTATHSIKVIGDALAQTGSVKVQANGVTWTLFDSTRN